jgi:hypothetical protein
MDGGSRRRTPRLSIREPITAADVENAAQRAADAKTYADCANKASAKASEQFAELRKRRRKWLPGQQTSNRPTTKSLGARRHERLMDQYCQ